MDKKETTIKQWVDANGYNNVELNCTICDSCPCKHTQLTFDGVLLVSDDWEKNKETKSLLKRIKSYTYNTLKKYYLLKGGWNEKS